MTLFYGVKYLYLWPSLWFYIYFMRRRWIPFAALAAVACQQTPEMIYPHSYGDATMGDTLYGNFVPDPYRWLEDDLNTQTREWIDAQNVVTQAHLSKIPFRDALRDRITEIWNYERIGAPFKRGDYFYFFRNDGLQNQSVLYRYQTNPDSAEVFLDPNGFSEDGTTSLASISFSKSGDLCAYSISIGGSDWNQVVILDVKTGQQIGQNLMDIKFSGLSWKGDEGFYYSSYDKPEGSELSAKTDHHKLYFHKIGTSQAADELIFGHEDQKRRYVNGGVTEDQQFLIISAQNTTTGNELYLYKFNNPEEGLIPLVDNFDHSHNVIYSEGRRLYIQTNLNAPNYRLVAADIGTPQADYWIDLIPETNMPLSASTAGGRIFASYLKDATTQVLQYNLRGEIETEVKLPGIGTASGFSGKKDEFELYYTFTSYVYPTTIFKYKIREGVSELYRQPKVDFNPDDFESYQVFYASKDGTQIPMIITHKKGLKKDGNNPTMLYGYGGFNVSLKPGFSPSLIVWLENGGIYAVPNLRGGGEYGKVWHDGGRLMNKQNVFDDYIAAAEYLIANDYTKPEKLGISGGSNGGLLVGATMTQRPELFAVALPAVGVLDMLRYHTFTAGAGWAYDYGTVEDSEEMFKYLLGYSPYHNLNPNVSYPATMVTTGDHDDRVVPAHSFKFAAKLQEVYRGPNPMLIRIETKAGHGAGKPTAMVIQEQADKWAFAFYNMGVRKL
jgi:prolyl oligopeptidase